MHTSLEGARKILDKVLADKPEEPPEENPIEEKPNELELMPSVPMFEPLKKEVIPLLVKLDIEDEYFTEYGNTSRYHSIMKPQKTKKISIQIEPLDPFDEAFLKKTTKELVSIISNEWLEESEISSEVIRLDSPSSTL